MPGLYTDLQINMLQRPTEWKIVGFCEAVYNHLYIFIKSKFIIIIISSEN